jgi:hypothetical protein
MKFTVPVYFSVSGRSAEEAEAKLKARLKGHQVGYGYKVGQAEANSVPSGIKISLELRNFLDAEIQNNDNDTSGWDTDLQYAFDSLGQMPDDVVIEQCGSIMLPDIYTELQRLIKKVGGTTQCATLVEQFDEDGLAFNADGEVVKDGEYLGEFDGDNFVPSKALMGMAPKFQGVVGGFARKNRPKE